MLTQAKNMPYQPLLIKLIFSVHCTVLAHAGKNSFFKTTPCTCSLPVLVINRVVSRNSQEVHQGPQSCFFVYESQKNLKLIWHTVYNIIVTGFVPRLWVNDVMKDLRGWYALIKQLRKRSLKKKKFRLQRDSNPWPLRYRCSALPTELWSHNCWEQVNFSGSIMPLRVIQHYSDWVCTAVMSKWRHERSSRLIRNLSNCEREAWKKKIQASAGFEPVTSAIPVQCSTNWAMKP